MDVYTREALRFANEVRRELGLLPRMRLGGGERGSQRACPIAETIAGGERGVSCAVNGELAQVWVGSGRPWGEPEHSFAVPKLVEEFVALFDCGGYPDLERFVYHDDPVLEAA